jgi:hypothetical protein
LRKPARLAIPVEQTLRAPATMSVRFERAGRGPAFDPSATAGLPGLSILQGGSGIIHLPGNTDGITFHPHPPSALAVETRRDRGRLIVAVRSTGSAVHGGVIEARRGSTVEARLMVQTLEWVEMPVITHSLRDRRRRSRRPLAGVPRLIDTANAILSPRACVSLVNYVTREIEIDDDLGPYLSSEGMEMRDLFAQLKMPPLTAVQLFFVWEIDRSRRQDTEGAALDGDFIAIEDSVRDAGQVLAHELGHFLGLGHTASRRDLMYESTPSGRRISFDHARRMNTRAMRHRSVAYGRPVTLDPIAIEGRAR